MRLTNQICVVWRTAELFCCHAFPIRTTVSQPLSFLRRLAAARVEAVKTYLNTTTKLKRLLGDERFNMRIQNFMDENEKKLHTLLNHRKPAGLCRGTNGAGMLDCGGDNSNSRTANNTVGYVNFPEFEIFFLDMHPLFSSG